MDKQEAFYKKMVSLRQEHMSELEPILERAAEIEGFRDSMILVNPDGSIGPIVKSELPSEALKIASKACDVLIESLSIHFNQKVLDLKREHLIDA